MKIADCGLPIADRKNTIFFMASRSSAAPAVHRFTRDEYCRMAEAGLFRDGRVELLDGSSRYLASAMKNTQ